MKKMLLVPILLCGLVLISAESFADNHGQAGGFTGPASTAQGGFTGPGPAALSVKQAVELADDTWITLKGHIVRHEGEDIYLFKDSSGEARVEIDDDAWGGQHIGPNDFVELVGKVDKDWGRVELEIERVRKAQ